MRPSNVDDWLRSAHGRHAVSAVYRLRRLIVEAEQAIEETAAPGSIARGKRRRYAALVIAGRAGMYVPDRGPYRRWLPRPVTGPPCISIADTSGAPRTDR